MASFRAQIRLKPSRASLGLGDQGLVEVAVWIPVCRESRRCSNYAAVVDSLIVT